MTKEDKQIIGRGIKENWRIGDRSRLKHLLEKNLKLYRENEELERENEEMKKGLGCETCQIHLEYMRLNDKIRELERLNSNQAESLRVTMLEEEKKDKRIAELEQQIEKMKCCENCGRYWLKKHNETVTACSSCNDKNMWRIKE